MYDREVHARILFKLFNFVSQEVQEQLQDAKLKLDAEAQRDFHTESFLCSSNKVSVFRGLL